jgi:hypothetical protein
MQFLTEDLVFNGTAKDIVCRTACPPVSSNEPIGPGASVNVETEPLRLVMAAAFAYVAKLPMYVYHSDAGVFGKTRFENIPGIERGHVSRTIS